MAAVPVAPSAALVWFLSVGASLSLALVSKVTFEAHADVHVAPTAFATNTLGSSSTARRRHALSRSRIARSPQRRETPAAGWWLLSAAGRDEEEEEEEYFPTEILLDDPSHVERILASMAELAPSVSPLEGVFKSAVSHHSALRTSNIARALKFYSLLGMNEVVRFKAENARCAFLEGAGMRLELIEVPASMEPADKADDLVADMRSTGLNHIAFDVGPAIEAGGLDGLRGFLSELNRQSEEAFGMSVRMVVSPYEQEVFDLAFIMDADGILLELLHKKATLDVEMPQAW